MKKTKKQVVRIGFFQCKEDPDSPKPSLLPTPWKGRDEFLKALSSAEYSLKPEYGKQKTCRVCGSPNGSGEYEHGGFRWPTGLYHLVKMHNVKPPEEFVRFVLGEQR